MFRFRLQSVLDVRKVQEDRVLIDYSEQKKVLKREEECLQSIRQQKSDLIDELRGLQGKSVNVSEIAAQSLNIKHCQESEAAQSRRVREASDRTDQKKAELLEAAQKRKAMEILKTHTLEKYLVQDNIRERSAVDEMASMRHQRREEE